MVSRTGCLLLSLLLVCSAVPALGAATPSPTQVEGIAYPVSPENEAKYLQSINEHADEFGVEPQDNVFLLYRDGGEYVVFTDSQPRVGHATVTGTAISTPGDGTEIGIIVASSVELATQGEPASLQSVRESPDQYAYQLVEVESQYRQVSYSLVGADRLPASRTGLGWSTDTDEEATVVGAPGNAGRMAVLNFSSADVGRSRHVEMIQRIRPRPALDPGLFVMARNHRFWMDANARVTIAVIPGSEFGTGNPHYLLADVTVPALTLSGPDAIQEHPARYDGEVVRFRTQALGATMSSRETLLEAKSCGENMVIVPDGCVPVVTDAALHTGVAYSQAGDGTAVVPFVALSNHRQDRAIEEFSGTYKLTGRVVSAQSLDPSLPDQPALIVYDMQRVDDRNGARSTQAYAAAADLRETVRAQLLTTNSHTNARIARATTTRASTTSPRTRRPTRSSPAASTSTSRAASRAAPSPRRSTRRSATN